MVRQRISVYGVALADDAILLARVSHRIPSARGMWTLPGGGMDWGESPEETLLREMYEETGLEPVVGPVLGIRSGVPPAPEGVENLEDIHLIQIAYRVHADGVPQVMEVDGSVDHAEWVPMGSITETNSVPLVRWGLSIL